MTRYPQRHIHPCPRGMVFSTPGYQMQKPEAQKGRVTSQRQEASARWGAEGGPYCTTGQHLCQTPFLFSFLPKPRVRVKGLFLGEGPGRMAEVTRRAAGGWDLPRQRERPSQGERRETSAERPCPSARPEGTGLPKAPAQAAGPA